MLKYVNLFCFVFVIFIANKHLLGYFLLSQRLVLQLAASPTLSYTGSAVRIDLSFFARCIMGFRRFLANNDGQKIKVHRRIIRMVFPMIQRAKNDRAVLRALPVYDNG